MFILPSRVHEKITFLFGPVHSIIVHYTLKEDKIGFGMIWQDVEYRPDSHAQLTMCDLDKYWTILVI